MANWDEWIGMGDQQIGLRGAHARQFHTSLGLDRASGRSKQWMQDFNAGSSAMGGISRRKTTNLFGRDGSSKLKPQWWH
jgi:hypothetical protein